MKREWRLTPNRSLSLDEDSEEIRKIKKVQSFFRGWLCRRRWKQIVIEYINSPHAENMRKRNRWAIIQLKYNIIYVVIQSLDHVSAQVHYNIIVVQFQKLKKQNIFIKISYAFESILNPIKSF